MTKYGTQFSGTDQLKRASGIMQNAAERAYKNVFNLAAEGGTAEGLKIADVGAGCCVDSVRIESDQNLSALTFMIGTPANPTKYGAAAAGPAANAVVIRYPPIALGLNATTVREEIFLFPSGAIPGAGTIRTKLTASHR